MVSKAPKSGRIPPPPEKPDPFECCGSGCVPCIFDYYDTALSEWQEQYGSVEDYYRQQENKGKAESEK